MPPNQPKVHQPPRDVGRFGGTAALDEPRQRAAVILEIVTHAIQPFGLRRSDQPLRREGGFTRCNSAPAPPGRRRARPTQRAAVPRMPARFRASGTADEPPLSCRLAEEGSCQSGRPPRRARRRSGPMKPHRPARTAAAASIGKRPGSAPKRRKARCSSGLKQLITPGDRRIHRLLAFGKIAWADRREQDIMRESAKQILSGQHFDPRRRQLERERQCIEPPANRRHGRAVRGREAKVGLHVSHAFHEQSHRGRARQIGRRHRV